jgi:hypothetical protein
MSSWFSGWRRKTKTEIGISEIESIKKDMAKLERLINLSEPNNGPMSDSTLNKIIAYNALERRLTKLKND